MEVFRIPVEFDWDQGNTDKPKKHGVTPAETEEAFFDENKVVFADWEHSTSEQRMTLLGKTKRGRLLNIIFTIRAKKIRIITARPINRKEVPLYTKNL